MMPRPPGVVDPYKWTLDLPPGPLCSVGTSANKMVDSNGALAHTGRMDEDRFYTCHYRDKVQVYMVLDGHDGIRACDFVQKHLPNVLLQEQLNGGGEAVKTALRAAFSRTERQFFLQIDPHITRKITLQIEMSQKASNSAEALRLYPDQVAEMERLDNQIKGGTTAAVAVIYNQKLYVANVGDSRVILCVQTPDGSLSAKQLSVDHNTSNEDELRRLAECGLDRSSLQRTKRLGTQQNTRSIGDYSIKGGYRDIDIISHARKEPGTAEPYVCEPVDLTNLQGFLVLMSDGLYDAYQTWTRRPSNVNDDLAHLIAQEMKKTSDISMVAQNIVEKVKYLFQSACQKDQRSGRLDDITLVVKNLGYPMGISHSVSHMPDQYTSSHIPPHPATIQSSMSVQPTHSHFTTTQPPYPTTIGMGGEPYHHTNVKDPRMGFGVGHQMPHVQHQMAHAQHQYNQHHYPHPHPGPTSFIPSDYNTGGAPHFHGGGINTSQASGVQSFHHSPGMGATAAPPPGVQPYNQHYPGVVTTQAPGVYHHYTGPQAPPVHTHRPPLQTMQSEPGFKHGLPETNVSHLRGSPQHLSGASAGAPMTLPAQPNQKKHEYENTKPSPRKFDVDPNNASNYVNVQPTNQSTTPSRQDQHQDAHIIDDSLRGTNTVQNYPPYPPSDEKVEVKLTPPVSQTPPPRPKSADVSSNVAQENPDGPPPPPPDRIKTQRSIEKKSTQEELFDMYGWENNGEGSKPNSMIQQPPAPTQGDQPNAANVPPAPSTPPPEQSQPASNISFFQSGNLPGSEETASRADEKKDEPSAEGDQAEPDSDKDSGDNEVGTFRPDLDSPVSSGPEETSMEMESGFLAPYVKHWPTLPDDLSWDKVPVET